MLQRGRVLGFVVGSLLAAGVRDAAASCRISNHTDRDFVVASGNVAGQRVKAHGTTTIAPGKVQGKTDDGRTISGTCKDGGDLVIEEKNGVPLLMPKAAPKPAKKSK